MDKWHCDYITWKALSGDVSDNISGVSGIGPKRASALAADHNLLQSFLSSSPEKKKQYELSRALVQLKDVDKDDLQVMQSNFKDKILFEEFQKRKCKSIIGNAWPKWIIAFQKAGGKHAF